MTRPLTYDEIYRNLDGTIALLVASKMPLRKQKGEYDTAFVKRIVAMYMAIAQPRQFNKEETGNGKDQG